MGYRNGVPASAAHQSDIRSVMDDIQRKGAAQPIWLVGGSRGWCRSLRQPLACPAPFAGLCSRPASTARSWPARCPGRTSPRSPCRCSFTTTRTTPQGHTSRRNRADHSPLAPFPREKAVDRDRWRKSQRRPLRSFPLAWLCRYGRVLGERHWRLDQRPQALNVLGQINRFFWATSGRGSAARSV